MTKHNDTTTKGVEWAAKRRRRRILAVALAASLVVGGLVGAKKDKSISWSLPKKDHSVSWSAPVLKRPAAAGAVASSEKKDKSVSWS